jgi:hypothetical protein
MRSADASTTTPSLPPDVIVRATDELAVAGPLLLLDVGDSFVSSRW